MKPIRILALAAATLLAACNGLVTDPVRTDVVYQADRQAYTLRDAIFTSLTNHSEARVGYNLCMNTLEMRIDGGWTRVARNPEHPCTLPLYSLNPGESATYREDASRLPGPGTYRLRTSVESPISGERREVVTNAFTVQ